MASDDTANENCHTAAQVLADADVLVLYSGAGLSADSGLAVFADVADIPAYQERGLDYYDLCQSQWLERAPELFYGFWGQCFEDYRKTQPHAGYYLIAKWRDDKNHHHRHEALVANDIRKHACTIMEQQQQQQNTPGDNFTANATTAPYQVTGTAGAFFHFTSNIDAHSYDVLEAHEIRECHGNVELWQCSSSSCCSTRIGGIWRAPLSHRFVVDTTTMLAPPTGTMFDKDVFEAKKDNSNSCGGDGDASSSRVDISQKAHIGDTHGSCRREALKYMPFANQQNQLSSEEERLFCGDAHGNWPKCRKCDQLARPAVLMFGDYDWQDDESQELRWVAWKEALYRVCEERATTTTTSTSQFNNNNNNNDPLKVCLLEIGCGLNVPTCRYQSEAMLKKLRRLGGHAKLVRINPDFPEPDDDDLAPHIIGIKSRGLPALEKIDAFYRDIFPFS